MDAKTELEKKEFEFVLTEEVVEEVAKKVSDSVSEKLVKEVTDKVTADVTKTLDSHVLKLEKSIKKIGKVDGADGEDEMSLSEKKQLFVAAIKDLINGNQEGLKSYNDKVKVWRNKLGYPLKEKAGYQNEATNADGGYVLMLPEFEAEIEKIMPMYGVAMEEATVRFVKGNRIWTNKRSSTVTMYETGEGQQKTGTKISIGQDQVTLRKFAGIAIVTDEMDEDAAIDFWDEFTQDFAEEWARITDVLVFTDRVSSTYPGALYMPGINVETVGAAITSLNWDDVANAEVKIPSRDMERGKWFMHRTIWNILRLSKDNEGRYQALPSGVRQTPWGSTIRLVDVMPSSSVVGDSNEPYALFGDLKRVKLYIKKGLVLEKSNEATVHDAAGNAVNLWEKDMTAIRAVARAVALVKFPEALVAVGTGTVS